MRLRTVYFAFELFFLVFICRFKSDGKQTFQNKCIMLS